MNTKIIILGSSGHGRVIAEILELLNYEIIGFIDSFQPIGKQVLEYKTLGNELILKNCLKKYGTLNLVLGIGNNNNRYEIYQKIRTINSEIIYPAIISPRAYVSKSATIGEGTVIMHNVIANTGSKIGRFTVLNTSSIIEHDCEIEDFSSLAPGVALGGNVLIGNKAYIGAGATIIQKREIGDNTVIAAGAVVTQNIPANVLAAGIPAIVKKENYKNNNLFR